MAYNRGRQSINRAMSQSSVSSYIEYLEQKKAEKKIEQERQLLRTLKNK